MIKFPALLLFIFSLVSLKSFSQVLAPEKETVTRSQIYTNRLASLGIIGDTTDVTTSTQAGTVLMGGGKDVDAAFAWMIGRSGAGNVVIIRASGTNAYNPYIYRLGKISSVETLKIDTRELANNENVVRIIRNAEMLFIAGGDQSVYMNQWKGTKTADAINYLINEKKAPVGGTSAGCAILGQLYYSGEDGSAVSDSVLANPYHPLVRLYKNDFLHISYLDNLITDQHYITRHRQGRQVVFMSRIISDWKIFPKAIAADERTAVCIDEDGVAQVFGSSKAYFIQSSAGKFPELCEAGKPLMWVAGRKALKVYEVQASAEGNGSFNVPDFDPAKARGGNWYWWWVENGVLKNADGN